MTEVPDLFNCIIHNETKKINIMDDCSIYIGFYNKAGQIAILAVSIIGCVLNFIFVFFQYLRIKRNNKDNRRQISMRKLLQLLPIFDFITSLYWIISASYFKTAGEIREHYKFCSILSIFYLVCFTFQFIMINFILFHFRKINLNPMQGILKPTKHVILYLLISLIASALISFLCFYLKIIGRSPMNTCFINTINDKNSLFFIIPIFFIFLVVFQIIYDLCCIEMFSTDRVIRKIHKKNTVYVLIFCILHIPLIVLFLHTSIIGKEGHEISETVYVYYSFSVSIITSMIPLITSLIRYCQGLTKIECINDFLKNNKISKIKKTRTLNKSNTINLKKDLIRNRSSSSLDNDPYEWLEKHVMEYLMRDIFFGIATSLKKSKKYEENIEKNYDLDSMKYEKYTINFETLDDLDLNDDSVQESDYLNIKLIDYAPQSFAYLRKLEKIDIDEMVESFLPKNNSQGLKESQGKSGSFFISTDDNKYMIKSLKSDEIDLIRNGFLKKYIQHIVDTENKSLLCRLYGMYNIIHPQGDETLLIVMRNVIGTLKSNAMVKFDLKGSTYKRRADFDVENLSSKVMKDLNFNEIEKNIKISQKNINELRTLISSDSKFLCNSGLMDYSLFLVKLTLNKEESENIFGKNIQKKQDKDIKELFSKNNIIDFDENDGKEISNLKIGDLKSSVNNSLKSALKSSVKSNYMPNDLKYYKQYLFPGLSQGTGYIISIIDYFQYFNFFKVVEAGIISKFKTGFDKKSNNTISCVDPITYSDRFINYFNQLTDISQIIEGSEVSYEDDDNEEKTNLIDNDLNKISNNNIDENDELNENNGINGNSDDNQVDINIKDKKANFNLRITIMNKQLMRNTSLRKTITFIKRNTIRNVTKDI